MSGHEYDLENLLVDFLDNAGNLMILNQGCLLLKRNHLVDL